MKCEQYNNATDVEKLCLLTKFRPLLGQCKKQQGVYLNRVGLWEMLNDVTNVKFPNSQMNMEPFHGNGRDIQATFCTYNWPIHSYL